MPGNDFADIEHCAYMLDLVFREFLISARIKDKRFALDALTSAFLEILWNEGFEITRDQLASKLAYYE